MTCGSTLGLVPAVEIWLNNKALKINRLSVVMKKVTCQKWHMTCRRHISCKVCIKNKKTTEQCETQAGHFLYDLTLAGTIDCKKAGTHMTYLQLLSLHCGIGWQGEGGVQFTCASGLRKYWKWSSIPGEARISAAHIRFTVPLSGEGFSTMLQFSKSLKNHPAVSINHISVFSLKKYVNREGLDDIEMCLERTRAPVSWYDSLIVHYLWSLINAFLCHLLNI